MITNRNHEFQLKKKTKKMGNTLKKFLQASLLHEKFSNVSTVFFQTWGIQNQLDFIKKGMGFKENVVFCKLT